MGSALGEDGTDVPLLGVGPDGGRPFREGAKSAAAPPVPVAGRGWGRRKKDPPGTGTPVEGRTAAG